MSKKSSWWDKNIRKVHLIVVIFIGITALYIAYTKNLELEFKKSLQENWTPIAWKNESILISDIYSCPRGQTCEFGEPIYHNEIRQIPTIEGKDCKIIEQENIYYEQGKGWLCHVGQLNEKCSGNETVGGCGIWCEPSIINKTACSQCRDAQTKEKVNCPN